MMTEEEQYKMYKEERLRELEHEERMKQQYQLRYKEHMKEIYSRGIDLKNSTFKKMQKNMKEMQTVKYPCCKHEFQSTDTIISCPLCEISFRGQIINNHG